MSNRPAPIPDQEDRERIAEAVRCLARLIARQVATEVCAGLAQTGEENCRETEENPDEQG